MRVNEVIDWWNILSEEERIEIFMNENPEANDDEWGSWWHYLTDDEKVEVFDNNY